MSKTSQLKSPTSFNSPKRLPIDEKIIDLRRRRAGILQEILELEALGAVPRETTRTTNIEQQALALLDDRDAKVVAVPARPSVDARLLELRTALQAYDRALEIAEQKCASDHGARSRELIAEYAPQWADAQRRRAKIIIELLSVNREVENLKKAMTSGGQFAGVALSDFTPRLFGTGRQQTPVNYFAIEFLKNAVKLGLIAEKDMEDV